ncbi:RING-H2 finger protein ATL65 [Apostasia shenzhenica]|uniref:RING-type E3 ubiquitin transferase n=1 Tax=Apostasia shenzhenica TaxID=1088818 RepID=A0A2I0ALZ4_9ASPA|nr:RING-H2 finger protein ATL65 [Apostasia shenzhenica]
MAAPASSPAVTSTAGQRPPAKISDNISPPLIAMVAVVGTAFLIVLYARFLSLQIRRLRRRWRRWRRRRRLVRYSPSAASSDLEYPSPAAFAGESYSGHLLPPYGLDDSEIKALPISLFSRSKAKQPAAASRDCAVCLFEFDDGEQLRTLPICSHAFHVECIDAWLRTHATCPICRATVSFLPMRAARIRPSLDNILLDPPPQPPPPPPDPESPEQSRSFFLLKRSYSFGFERSAAADDAAAAAAAATASPPWRHRQQRGFWSKRWPSPFAGVGSSARGFSFRSYYHRGGSGVGMKSPFMRRWGFLPLSGGGGGGGGWGPAGSAGRRSRSMTSPAGMWAARPSGGFSSSRMRCGDPEALLSPERLSRR